MQQKGRALDKALRALAARSHSEKEIVNKLARAGYDEHEIAEAMAALSSHALVDDAAFAMEWAVSRAKRGLGQRRIAHELREKGIDRETADAALAQIDEDTALENARALAEKHLRRGGNAARRRALDALSRRGFGYGLAMQAIALAALAIESEET